MRKCSFIAYPGFWQTEVPQVAAKLINTSHVCQIGSEVQFAHTACQRTWVTDDLDFITN